MHHPRPHRTQLFAAVHTAARLHTPVNVTHTLGRVEVKWDIPWMMGLFGENDSLALWDLRKHPEQGGVVFMGTCFCTA